MSVLTFALLSTAHLDLVRLNDPRGFALPKDTFGR